MRAISELKWRCTNEKPRPPEVMYLTPDGRWRITRGEAGDWHLSEFGLNGERRGVYAFGILREAKTFAAGNHAKAARLI